MKRYWHSYKSIFLYGIFLAVLLLLLKWLEWQYIIVNYTVEIYGGVIAMLFTCLGIWLAFKLNKPKTATVYVDREVALEPLGEVTLNLREINRLKISERELEVLQLMAEGLSNQQIADKLFLSLNTIKTHSSNLFDKMEVQRRTQAVDMGRKLSIIR